mgnify:CR=1 FL=1
MMDFFLSTRTIFSISSSLGLITTLQVLIAIAFVVSVTVSVIQAFRSPKPSKISFGFQGDLGGSPRYGHFGPLDNTVSNEIAVPVLYGKLKLAGNIIWQTDPGETVKRIVGLCEGEVSTITDVRANDVVINDANTPNSSYTTYVGTAAQKADSRVPANIRQDMELHHTAYIALTLTASEGLKGGNPAITSVVEGTLVEVWSAGTWGTTKSYSRNPAACVRDFIINARYGLGILKANLDEASFGSVYDYCEELVDGPSGKEARFVLDYISDTQRPAQDVLNDMLSTFTGFLVYAGNKVKLRVEKTESITQYFGDGSTTKANATFDPGNIVRDSFSWNMSSIDDRPNRIKIQWVDPDQNYVKIYTQVEDKIDQDSRGTVIVKEVSLLGITRQSQASRMAKLQMAITKYANLQVSWSARLESIHCEVGDVAALTHQAAKFTRRLMRITTMQEAEDETIRFTGRDYIASLYDDHQATAIITYTQPSGPNLYAALSDVTGITVREDNFKNKDGVFVTNILTSWTAIPADQLLRLDRHIIQLSSDGGSTYRDVAFAGNDKTSYRIVLGNVQTGTTFTVRIKTLSDRGAESAGTTAALTIQGKTTPPSNVENFDVNFAFDHISMTWSAIDDADLFAYEIRSGNANSLWETAAIVATEVLTTKFDLFTFTRGEKKFFIKAIDNSANYSETASVDTINITSIPESNVTFTFDLFSRMRVLPHPLEGTLSSELTRIPAADYSPLYNRLTLQPRTVDTWNDRLTAGGTWATLQASSFRFGRETYVTTEETYETQSIDVGSKTNGSYILDIQTYSSSNLGFVSIDIATSDDNVTFSAFKPFVAGQFNTRYVRFKFKIQATNSTTVVRLVSAILTVDVPDIRQSFLNESVSAGGRTFYLTGFNTVKSIVMTIVGTSNLMPRISDQSNLPNSFDIRIFDTTGTLQAGSVNIYCTGYGPGN